ncbi:MAG: hypothetical protein ACLQBC_03890 [Syntrophales bacterium]
MKKITSSIVFFAAFILIAVMAPIEIWAAWSNDPTVNTAISTEAGAQTTPQIVTDGAGGAIITWQDQRPGASGVDIYAQSIDVDGIVKWTTNGVAISTAIGDQTNPQIVADGAGGAIITWQDARNGAYTDIYAQRIGADGIVKWATNGVAISTVAYNQTNPQIVSDGAGGAIITWTDARNGTYTDIYAQRVDENGNVQWTQNGVPICTAAYAQINPQIVTDGAGGAIITWQDYRSNVQYDVYAQRIDYSGAVQWTVNGVKLTTGSSSLNQTNPTIIADTVGAIITWQDDRPGGGSIYAQKIDLSGNLLWAAADGVAIYTTEHGTNPTIVDDGNGGAIITWMNTYTSDYKIYAQRIDNSGTVPVTWPATGLAIGTANGDLAAHPLQISSDGSGGAIIVWQYYNSNNNYDIYAQKVTANGTIPWTPTASGVAVAISTATGDQLSPQITSDGSGGAIITWQDSRNGNADIYAQKVLSDGTLSTLLYAEFAGAGIWEWNGTIWSQVTPYNPDFMSAAGSLLYGSFAGNGIWEWNGTTWSQVTSYNPQFMSASGSLLYGSFAANGIWEWDGTTWSQVTPFNPDFMSAAGSLLYGSFAGNGIWEWNGTTWSQVTPYNPQFMSASGSLLYGSFVGSGIWEWNGTTWSQVTPYNPQFMSASGSLLYGNFAGNGIWEWNGTTWSQTTPYAPTSMVVN